MITGAWCIATAVVVLLYRREAAVAPCPIRMEPWVDHRGVTLQIHSEATEDLILTLLTTGECPSVYTFVLAKSETRHHALERCPSGETGPDAIVITAETSFNPFSAESIHCKTRIDIPPVVWEPIDPVIRHYEPRIYGLIPIYEKRRRHPCGGTHALGWVPGDGLLRTHVCALARGLNDTTRCLE